MSIEKLNEAFRNMSHGRNYPREDDYAALLGVEAEILRLRAELAALTAPVGEDLVDAAIDAGNAAYASCPEMIDGEVGSKAHYSMKAIIATVTLPIRAQAAKEATEKERQRCADIADGIASKYRDNAPSWDQAVSEGAEKVAAAIRGEG